MATKKQKRRRAKEQRHDYVWIDDEGTIQQSLGIAVTPRDMVQRR